MKSCTFLKEVVLLLLCLVNFLRKKTLLGGQQLISGLLYVVFASKFKPNGAYGEHNKVVSVRGGLWYRFDVGFS